MTHITKKDGRWGFGSWSSRDPDRAYRHLAEVKLQEITGSCPYDQERACLCDYCSAEADDVVGQIADMLWDEDHPIRPEADDVSYPEYLAADIAEQQQRIREGHELLRKLRGE